MKLIDWRGVFPAITTPFRDDGEVDLGFLAKHANWMVDAGCDGIVALGSLGEGGTLDPGERRAVLEALVANVGARAPVVASVAALSTKEGVRQAREAEAVGCRGLMVLPPYAYVGSWVETRGHFSAIFDATGLGCMLYNNPIAYRTDVRPEQIAELAVSSRQMTAVKESSADIRRIAHIRALVGDRLRLFSGVDDQVVEGVMAGTDGWVAGLVNALPKESMELWRLARSAAAGNPEAKARVRVLYEWFLPLLRLDVVPEFVQLIKLAQWRVGMGSPLVRRPRLQLESGDAERALKVIDGALASARG